jgi:anti-sigma regulatory factor (Ser/Thr protein kinase)
VKELSIAATVENIETVTAFVDEQLEALDCPMKAQMQIDIALDEILSNVAHYAYAPGTGPVTVRVGLDEATGMALVTFIDRGVRYDPLAKEDPDVSLSVEEREVGGLGIFLVRKTMDDMTYEYVDGRNVLHIRKCF